MANTCSTTVRITGDKKEMAILYANLNKALEEKESVRLDRHWLGNLLRYLGYETKQIENSGIRCRGNVVWLERTDHNTITIDTDTAWVPMIQVINKFVERYAPNATLYYTAEEPGCGLFWTNDPEVEDEYLIDTGGADDVPESLGIDDCYRMGEDGLKALLFDALGYDKDICTLIRDATEKWEGLSINKYEYVPISECD